MIICDGSERCDSDHDHNDECDWCGILFIGDDGETTCSDQCKKEMEDE